MIGLLAPNDDSQNKLILKIWEMRLFLSNTECFYLYFKTEAVVTYSQSCVTSNHEITNTIDRQILVYVIPSLQPKSLFDSLTLCGGRFSQSSNVLRNYIYGFSRPKIFFVVCFQICGNIS